MEKENERLTKRIAEVQALLNEALIEYADKEEKHERELEAMRKNYRILMRKDQLANFVIENYVPKKDLKKIARKIDWNSEIMDYVLEGVAFAGNNMRRSEAFEFGNYKPIVSFDNFQEIYQKYAAKREIAKKIPASLPDIPGASR